MSTENKILTGVLASAITGLLVSFHVVDPGQADTVVGMLQTGFGLLISCMVLAYGFETLIIKHRAEVADKHFLIDVPEPPVTPVTPSTTSTASVTQTLPITPAV